MGLNWKLSVGQNSAWCVVMPTRQRLHSRICRGTLARCLHIPEASHRGRWQRVHVEGRKGGKKREGGERERQRSKKTPLENGLGKVCGEPVARQ